MRESQDQPKELCVTEDFADAHGKDGYRTDIARGQGWWLGLGTNRLVNL